MVHLFRLVVRPGRIREPGLHPNNRRRRDRIAEDHKRWEQRGVSFTSADDLASVRRARSSQVWPSPDRACPLAGVKHCLPLSSWWGIGGFGRKELTWEGESG